MTGRAESSSLRICLAFAVSAVGTFQETHVGGGPLPTQLLQAPLPQLSKMQYCIRDFNFYWFSFQIKLKSPAL